MSMPMVATPSEATRPRQQNSAIVLIGWVSVLASETASVRTFEMAFMATLIIHIDACHTTSSHRFQHLFTCRKNGFEGAANCFVVSRRETIAIGRRRLRCDDTDGANLELARVYFDAADQRMMPSKLAAMPRANNDQSKPSASAR